MKRTLPTTRQQPSKPWKRIPLLFCSSLIEHRELLAQMAKRDIRSRYKGSALGAGWALAQPLLMLGVYTFVFSGIFQSRWGDAEDSSTTTFAINLFAGLIVFSLVAECANTAPNLVLANKNFVTKVVFPLEILGASTVLASLFQACISLLVLLVFECLTMHKLPSSLVLLPATWAPLVLGCLAMTWVLSAVGVYFRDLGQITGVCMQALMFLSAVFYPVNALPEKLRSFSVLNPLIGAIDQTRAIVVRAEWPSLTSLGIASASAVIACELAFRFFRKAKRGFADVI